MIHQRVPLQHTHERKWEDSLEAVERNEDKREAETRMSGEYKPMVRSQKQLWLLPCWNWGEMSGRLATSQAQRKLIRVQFVCNQKD